MSEPQQDILTHTEAGVLTLTLNRLAKKNSFTASMYSAMADVLLAAQDDAAVRVLLMTALPVCD